MRRSAHMREYTSCKWATSKTTSLNVPAHFQILHRLYACTHDGQVRGCAVLGDDHDDDAGLWGHIPRHALRTHLRRLCGPYQHARFLLLHGKCRGSYLPGTHSRGKDVTRALAFFICGSACLCARSLDCVSDISVRAFAREFSRFQAWRTGIKISSEP